MLLVVRRNYKTATNVEDHEDVGGVGDGHTRVVVKKLVFMLMKKRMGEMGDGGAVKEEKDYNRGAQNNNFETD